MLLKLETAIMFLDWILLHHLAAGNQCQRDKQFVKVKPDGLPEINPIKVVTATEEAFCSMECTDHQECKSFVYLDYTSSDNCMLSSNVDGASVSGATGTVAIYKEVIPEVPMGCDPNPCLNGGTCVDTCEKPYFICTCPEETEGQVCKRIFRPFYARFTNLNGYGRSGPTTLGTYYDGQAHKNLTTLQNGIQFFTVPYTGTYTITAVGAAGGMDKSSSSSSYRARGAKLIGNFKLEKGEILKILVGQLGYHNSAHSSSGGGGGTFVVSASNTPLIIAGGGGGVESVTQVYGNSYASTGSSGKSNYGGTSWKGGSNGDGATEADGSNSGGGGGGFYSNGRSGTNFGGSSGFGGEGGRGFLQGGVGGRSYKYNGEGGFGGGGGAYGNGGGAGGGGGYSGGASGDNFVNSCGGGGCSYNGAFQNIVRIAGYRGFHGYVTINRIY